MCCVQANVGPPPSDRAASLQIWPGCTDRCVPRQSAAQSGQMAKRSGQTAQGDRVESGQMDSTVWTGSIGVILELASPRAGA